MERRQAIKSLMIGSAAVFTFQLLTKEMVASDAVYGMNDLMYWKLETTGVLPRVRDGKIGIQLRYSFYLTDKSAFYKKHLVDEKRAIKTGMKFSEIDKKEVPEYKYENTGKKINPPFHNHIVVIPEKFCTDGFITSLGDKFLKIVYDYYQKGYYIDGNNPPINNTVNLAFDDFSDEVEVKILERIETIKNSKKWQ